MPRAALLSIHARVSGTEPNTWEDPSLVQLWGPRYQSVGVHRMAGVAARQGSAAFDGLRDELTPVQTPIGERWILASDEAAFLAAPQPAAEARLLPSGDAYWLLQGADRELLVPDGHQRSELWTPRVWPGALLVGGEIVGTWRRAHALVTIATWRRLSSTERASVEEETASLPLPSVKAQMAIRFE